MARPPKSAQIITANRLLDGRVVFLTGAGKWEASVGHARVFADPVEAEQGLTMARQAAAGGEIVDPYAVAVSAAHGHITPILLRERIRAEGPTIGADARIDRRAA